ncbi:hypothetical protein EJ05DRAFT_491337 [Pseudovirgaria hyperparasitica]|uniref:N-acetylgalactosaminide beta-1,3-galactosyltransferase n=1 Tax=Pseudovirgaria hyperparasitica TaxID=470096 RepID=A0A6A6WNC0_9PEZI|nr:uncharacterized protein EJ05DRAFT_491337 [Pseudovirgaria hyperparasitica]KAF2763539.1 hypothetical protein EJ05DRAFT_491337 [Pseudovirgaria hyperparasitica]
MRTGIKVLLAIGAAVSTLPRSPADIAPHSVDDDEDAQVQHHNIPQPASDADQEPPCPHAALSSDFLIVIRTGATEAPQKLPVHFRTTLTCISSYIIYSDLSETITGHPVHDVLAHISESTRSRVPDFTHWRHLREHGRAGLDDAILYGSGPAGALENPGWKLDKFKFLPMTRAALDYRPDAKWYVFLEPDTYLSAQNLATYLANFDAEKPHYIGKHMFLDDVLFAHGGSGFVLSRPAMQKLAAHYSSHEEDLDAITEKSWAGDGVLAKALQQVDINLFVAWPHFQGDAVASLDFNISKLDRRPWCYAPATWHHMRADEVQALWGFETEWREKHGVDAVLRHRDVFAGMIKPNLSVRKPDWDNLSTDTEYNIAKVAHKSFENCRAVCANRQECIQFSYSNGKCSVSANVKLGYPATSQCLEYSNAAGGCVRRAEVDANGGHGVSSGWMMERVQKRRKGTSGCYEWC